MYCTKCGKEIESGSKFCENCGEPVIVEDSLAAGKAAPTKGKLLAVFGGCCAIAFMILAISIVNGQKQGKGLKTKETHPQTSPVIAEETYPQQETSIYAETTAKQEVSAYMGTTAQQEISTYEETDPEQETTMYIETISMDRVSSVTASSALSEYGMTHSADRIIDQDLSTAWVEGVTGLGDGEYVTILFDDIYKVSGFSIYAGYQKSVESYKKNARPRTITLEFSDGSQEIFELSDYYGEQILDFSEARETSSITIRLESAYPGNKYEDTVISEVYFY